jgi:hypothetical protein
MHLIKSISIFPYGGKICSKHRNEFYSNDIQTNKVVDQVSSVHSWEIAILLATEMGVGSVRSPE